MIHPILSTSLDDLWSHRWHQLLRTSWVAFAFRPTRHIAQRLLVKRLKNPMPVVLLLSALSVFAISGLMHEYIIYCNVGWSVYRRFFLGQQLYFFFIHGLGVVFERVIKQFSKRILPSSYRNSFFIECVQRLWVLGFGFYTFPAFLDGFSYWGVWHDNPLTYVQPYILRALRAVPEARPFCGSLLGY